MLAYIMVSFTYFGLLLPVIDCPRASPGPGRPRSGPRPDPNVRVQVQIQADPDPNFESRSSWGVDWTWTGPLCEVLHESEFIYIFLY